MSMAHEIKIRNLEERLKELEDRMAEIFPYISVEPEAFRIKQTWRGRFDVYQGEVKVNDQPLLKAEAERMADEMNA